VSAEQALAGWWRAKAESEIEMVVAKAVEYGARDLVEMGRSLAHMAGREGLTDAQHAELGCLAYAVGKMARIEAAWHEGRMPSDDSWLDLGVYVRMVQRIREAGGWPGVPLPGPGRATGGHESPPGPSGATPGSQGLGGAFPGLGAEHDCGPAC
jgi:hypothetical protein